MNRKRIIVLGALAAVCVAAVVLVCVLFVGRRGGAVSPGRGGDGSDDVLRAITDISFLTYCTSQLKIWDTNGDTRLSPDEARCVSTMSIMDRGISSLAGLEYFTGLVTLDCRYNNLSVLDVSKNTALTTLWCDGNKLRTLDISANTAIDNLAVAGNPGDGEIFPVTTWRVDGSAPKTFPVGIWTCQGIIITPEFR